MQRTEPKVFMVAVPQVAPGLVKYLDHVNPEGGFKRSAPSDGEHLVEVMGRLCYRSFAPGLNANVTRVREGNAPYLANILKVGHGSVLEHAQVSFIFADVSRVFTHELVRHRVGCAISQESLRFVRLDELKGWMPSCIAEDEEAAKRFEELFESLEVVQKQLAVYYGLDDPDADFKMKKEISSALRRMAPIGLATTIGWSANFRTLRHVIRMRTSRHAEEEIRLVFDEVAKECQRAFPNVFQDFSREEVDGIGEWTSTGSA